MAKRSTGEKNLQKRKKKDRRSPMDRPDDLRWSGYGEIVPDRRTKRRRKNNPGGSSRATGAKSD